MEQERRREPRFGIEQLVEISFGRELQIRARGTDLSRQGMRCVTDDYLEPSTVVILVINLPDEKGGKRVRCNGIVVWCEEEGASFVTGISFGPFSAEDEVSLDAFMEAERAERDSGEAIPPPATGLG